MRLVRFAALVTAVAAAAPAALAGPDCGRLPKGKNPESDELAKEIAKASAKHGVPTEVIKAVAWQESGAQQWRPDGSFVHNVTDCGLGMMQLTGATAKQFDLDKLKDDWRYNLDAGVKVLRQKWERAEHEGKVTADPAERAVLENWFYAVAYYYGKKDESYVAKIWAHAAKRPGRLAQLLARPVEITLPSKAIAGFAFGRKFKALRGDRFVDDQGVEHKAPTHGATIGDEETLAKLEVLLARGKKSLEQGKFGDALKAFEQVAQADLDTDHKTQGKAQLERLDAEAKKKLEDAVAKAADDGLKTSKDAAIALARRLQKELPGRPAAQQAKEALAILE